MKAKFSNDRFGLKTNRYEKESEQRFPVCAGLCLAAVFGLSACKDDDEGGGDGGAGAVAQQMPLVANAGIQFPVTQYLNEDYSEMETYTYADGRMTGAATSWEGYSYLITSNPLVLVEQSYYSDTEYGSSTMRNIRVNENGFMTYAEFSFEESDSYDGNSYDRGYNTWEYDADQMASQEQEEPYAALYVLYRNDIVSYDSNGTRHSMKEDMLDKFYIEILKTSNADSVYSITVRNNESFEETTISFDYKKLSDNQINVTISDKEESSQALVYNKLTGKEQTPVE